jgi:hypothetical protein
LGHRDRLLLTDCVKLVAALAETEVRTSGASLATVATLDENVRGHEVVPIGPAMSRPFDSLTERGVFSHFSRVYCPRGSEKGIELDGVTRF